jgi:HK97 family phage prohead protease
MGDTLAPSRRSITLDTGRRKVDAPVDALGRERWRARMDSQRIEMRDHEGDGDGADFFGHAAMFNKRTWIGPRRFGFWEQVAPGAFDKTVGEADVRFLVNHDPNLLLARNKSGTLTLDVDDGGLATAAKLDRRQSYTNDVVIALERGDISQMSFAFEVVRDTWEILDDDTELRTLDEVRLWDVSVVTYPAYEDTDAGLRAVAFEVLCRSAGIDDDQRDRLLQDLTGLAHVADPVTPEPGSSTQDDGEPGSSTRASLALRQRRLHSRAVRDGLNRS